MSSTLEPVHFNANPADASHIDQQFTELVRRAAAMPASDLYFTWNEHTMTVSARHLGTVRALEDIPREQGARIVNHVKASAGMDVAQKLRPIDGRWACEIAPDRTVDLRISTIPTLHGEDMAVRILDRHVGLLDVENLGFCRKNLLDLVALLGKPGGLILVTGPGGSGKTTTLYACLRFLQDGSRKINTIEDPIEYSLEGIRQSQVNLKADLDFPTLLRSVLRQTPDVIMVGEVRDPVTAQTVVRAANSGHLVFATLHAPIAAGAVESMLAFGIEPHFLAASLVGIFSQRLVRKLCPCCSMVFDTPATPRAFEGVRRWLKPHEGRTIHGAPGCDYCDGRGTTERTGVVEVLRVTREIRHMIHQRRRVRDIHDKAVEQGMLDLRRSALLKVAQGIIGPDEVVRVIPSDDVLAG